MMHEAVSKQERPIRESLRVLILEDNPLDAKLTARLLKREGYDLQFEVTDSQVLFQERLKTDEIDVIVADFNLRGWTALDALEILKQSRRDIPFIVMTGTMGDEVAVDLIKNGASDYILKDRQARLPLAIRHALEEKKLRQEHHEAEAKLLLQSAALEAAANGIVITNREGTILWANSAFALFTGYTVEEAVGKNPRILNSGRQNPEFFRYLWDTILAGKVWHGELINRRKDGSLYHEELTITPVLNAQGTITNFIAIKQDVTQRKVLETQLQQAVKMEAVGTLAGGVAHDFNNLLTIINGYAELLIEHVDDDKSRIQLREIKSAGDRAASLTRQLLTFSRRQVLAPQMLDLNTVVSGLEKMLKRLIGEDVTLRSVLKQPLGRVKADPGQIEQVIMNLAVNARDAMPQGGKLTIETANVELDATYAARHALVTPGQYVMLAVADTGTGMNAETQAHLFEPFFTTKGKDKGTGLGLATVYGIVRQSGGHIWVYSEPWQGATFKIYLPRIEESAESVVAPETPEPIVGGSETILLVEDEDALRALAAKVLQEQGYRVLESTSPENAIEIADRHQERIDLLLTDVVMPRISGREIAERLALQRPGMKVLYMSGYTDDSVVRHGVLEENTAFLQKPFTPAVLARKVREVLDTAPQLSKRPGDGGV